MSFVGECGVNIFMVMFMLLLFRGKLCVVLVMVMCVNWLMVVAYKSAAFFEAFNVVSFNLMLFCVFVCLSMMDE